ncbi:MAG: AAA family ATPase [Deltaproteobacteria bacterium]|nr:AAA family ATPase [Deltaproteobacteria bacterium]
MRPLALASDTPPTLADWLAVTASRVLALRDGRTPPGGANRRPAPSADGAWTRLVTDAGLAPEAARALECLVAGERDILAGRALDRLARDAGPAGTEVQAIATVLDYLGIPPDTTLALFAPGAELARWGLVTVSGEGRVASRRIMVAPRLVAHLRGDALPPVEEPPLERVGASPLAQLTLPAGIADEARAHASALARSPWWLIGPRSTGKRTVAASALAETGRALLQLRMRDALAADRPRLLALLAREVLLNRAAIALTDLDDAVSGRDDALPGLVRALYRAGIPLVLTSTMTPALASFDTPLALTELRALEPSQRTDRWRRELPTLAGADEIGARYRLAPGRIVRIATRVRARTAAPTLHDVAAEVSAEVSQQVTVLGDRVQVTQHWGDLVLPPTTLDAAREMVARVRGRHQVLATWGFADKLQKGLGVSALFAGAPGTGKTMVAGIIARELGLELYQIDLARVVSKYVGETERNLGAVFDAAEAGNVMLLFDEADALFGKRTEAKSSNDRYANLEINYLLQRLERFEGVCVLTTNLAGSIDPAFRRRLSFRIDFPVPDVEERAELWCRAFPDAAPVAHDLDVDALAARYELAGGYIRNAALRAAYLAAAAGSVITAPIVERAVALEYHDAGKLSTGGRLS